MTNTNIISFFFHTNKVKFDPKINKNYDKELKIVVSRIYRSEKFSYEYVIHIYILR